MKKLFFSLLALMSTFSASAQDLAAGDYYLRNVESGKYIAWGHNWGTRTVLTEHGALLRVSLNNGAYTLGTQATANYTKAIRPSDGFADQSGTWTLENAGDGQYRIKGSAGYYRYDGTNVPAVNGAASQTGVLWEFLTKDQLTAKMSEATMANPADATHFIKSPDFLTNDNNITAQKAWGVNIAYNNGQPTFKGEAGGGNTIINNTNLEIWNNTSNNIKQTLTGLPKGTYKLSFFGLYRDGGPTEAATARTNGTEQLRGVVYAGDVQLPVMSIFEYAGAHGIAGTPTTYGNVPNSNGQAAQHFEAGDYLNTLYFQVAEDNGSVTIGINKETKSNNDWFVVDNFDLKYFGDCTIEEAQNGALIAEWEEYVAGFDAKAATLDAAGQSSYNTAKAAITTPTSAETLEAAKTTLANAYIAAIKAQTSEGADFTGIIVNPDFSTGNINGWTDTFTAGNHGYQSNNTYVNGDAKCIQFMECWIVQPNTLANGKLSQVLKDLPAGNYTLTADVNSCQQSGKITKEELTGVYIFATCAAGTFRSEACATENGKPETFSFTFNTTAGDCEIGLMTENTNCNWVAFDNCRLVRNGDVTINIYQEALKELVANSKTTYEEECKDGLLTDYTTAYNAAKTTSETDGLTDDDYLAANTALTNAKTAIETSIALFANNKVALPAQKALIDGTNIYDAEGYNAYVSAYEAALAAYENHTATEPVVNPTAATGWHTSTAYNFLLAPWTIGGEACNNFDKALYINTWSTEGNGDGSNFTTPFFEYWVADGQNLAANTISTTLDVENGLYEVSALVRASHNADDFKAVNLTVNEGDAVNVADGAQIGTTNRYMNTFTAQGLVKDGKLTITFDVPAESKISWFCFKNVKYTKVRDLTPEETITYATAEEIAAFNEAIAAAEAKTVGFMKGEYATYTNAAAIKALAAAQAIDTENPVAQETVLEATTALTAATWTANTEEMNAVYDGTFANAENNGAPAGWTMSNNTLGGSLHSRAFVGDTRLSEFNETNSGLFLRFDGTNSNRGSMYFYGRAEGYEMPLKANTKYYVSVDFAGWGSTGKPLRLNVTGPEGFTAVGAQANTTVKADTENKDPQNHYIVFTTAGAGNYQINFQTPGADSNTHNVVVSNIELKTLPESEVAVNVKAANHYGTLIVPFDAELPEGISAYTVEETEGAVLTLVHAESLKANTAYIIENTTENNIADAVHGYQMTKTVEDTYTTGLLTGTYKQIVGVEQGKYLLQNQGGKVGFYKVPEEGTLKLGANRCYLTKPDNGGDVKAFFFDEETAIKALDALTSGKAEIFDMNGRKLSKMQKGVNIVNGVKVLVK